MMTDTDTRETLTPSATVILVRPHGDRFQVYLIRRSRKSGFMGGLFVFPGGVVDPEDRDPAFWLRHVDMSADRIDEKIGGEYSTDRALSYGVAAIRETLEESGVFFAHRNGAKTAAAAPAGRLRQRQQDGPGWFAEQVAAGGWTLSLSVLNPWSRWITPVGMSRRFVTLFYLAVMPEAQQCSPDAHETIQGVWATPRQGLAANLDGEIPLSPPTVVTLHQLLAYQSLEQLLAGAGARDWGETIRPRMLKHQKGAVIIEPWDPQYEDEALQIDPEQLEKHLVPAGEPFSRIWFHEGRWRTVGAG
jgi:8-oxo-dGTP pyrophosphatase MutT (NUDIX family)